MTKHHVKIILEENEIKKQIVDTGNNTRKFIIISADGLPYKQMIEILSNRFKCAECGKKLKYVTELSSHLEKTSHSEFFQLYGNVLLNIGNFHYVLTMIRSLTKLLWEVDLQELSVAILMDSPKAQFMLSKCTDFRKCWDFFCTARTAKLREIVSPFVKYYKFNNIEESLDKFLQWQKKIVKNETYMSVYNVEKYLGTSLKLYLSAIRANNFDQMTCAKKVFSPLFHCNSNPNYSVIDIHCDYQDEAMKIKAPELSKSVNKRRFTNKTGRAYGAEPHDERL